MMPPRIFTCICQAAVIMALVLLAPFGRASTTPDVNYNGHYEMVDLKAARVFSLKVKQTKHDADVTFSAAMADGSGPAPDGAGKGRIEKGVLSFKFKDSFNNEGTCTLQPSLGATPGLYQLSITVTKAVDPSPFHFYGSVLLKKAPDRP
jgi:hypothetical protein